MKEQKTTFTEQIAEEGGYITQAAEVSDEERLYLTPVSYTHLRAHET